MSRRDKFKDAKRRREAGGFVALPHNVIRSDQFARLTPFAAKLLLDLLAQHRGNNNGDLCAAWSLMKPRGWKSKDTLQKAIRELREGDWIEVARQGGRHKATLYSVSFYAIDDCGGKLDVSQTGSPSGAWRKNQPLPVLTKLKVVPR